MEYIVIYITISKEENQGFQFSYTSPDVSTLDANSMRMQICRFVDDAVDELMRAAKDVEIKTVRQFTLNEK